MAPPAPGRSRARALQLALGTAVSGALLWLAFRDVHFADVVAHARTAHAGPLLLAVAVATSTFGIRVLRWLLLLRREDGSAYAALPLWHAVAMGFMGNNVLPFRAGELLRAFGAVKLAGARFTAAVSSIGMERVFDAIALVTLLAGSLAAGGAASDQMVGGRSLNDVAVGGAVFCAVALAAAGLVVLLPDLTERLIRALVPARGLAERLVGVVEGVRQGLASLRSPTRFAGVIGWSLGLWLWNGVSFWLGFRAFDIEVGLAGALVMQALLAFGIAVPSTPGFVGVFEFVITTVLALYGVPHDRALAFAVTYHVTTFVPITLLGVYSLWRTPVALSDLRGAPGREAT